MRPGEGRDLPRVVAHEDRAPELCLGRLLVDLEDQLAGPVPGLERHAEPGRHALQLGQPHCQINLHAGVLRYELDQRRPPPGRGEIDLATLIGEHRRAEQLLGSAGDEILEDRHHVGVVAVGLVELEHREFRVVAGRRPFVAEGPPDLEDTLDPANHAALKVQLRRDAQIDVGVQRVVVGDERPRRCAAGDWVQHRRLDLHEAGSAEAAPDGGNHLRSQQEDVADALVGPEVDLSLPVADVGVADTAPLVAEAAARVREKLPGGDLDRQLASFRADDLAADPDPVAERQAAELVELRSERGEGE